MQGSFVPGLERLSACGTLNAKDTVPRTRPETGRDGSASAPLDLVVGGYTPPVAGRDRGSLGIRQTGYVGVGTSQDQGANVPAGNTPSLPVLRNLAEATR